MLMEHHMEQQIKNLIGRKNVFSGMLHTFLNDQVPAPIVLFYLKLQVQLSLLHPFIFVLAMKSNLSPECLAQSICSRIVKFPIRWFSCTSNCKSSTLSCIQPFSLFGNHQIPAQIILMYLQLQVKLSLLYPIIFVLAMKSNVISRVPEIS